MDSNESRDTHVVIEQEPTPQQHPTFVIYLGGRPGSRVARCYDEATSEHIWSSEGAVSYGQALRDIDRALQRLDTH